MEHGLSLFAGLYKPDQDEGGYVTSGDRAAPFHPPGGLIVRGGYAGLAEPNDPNSRDIALYETILSGDLLPTGTAIDIDGDGVPNFCPCPADLDNDFQITLTDLGILLTNFGTGTQPEQGDVNGDGVIDLTDLGMLLLVFGLSCI